MIIRQGGAYYGIDHNGKKWSILAWRFYANSGCVLAKPNEAYDYFCDPWLEHYLMQADEGSVTGGALN